MTRPIIPRELVARELSISQGMLLRTSRSGWCGVVQTGAEEGYEPAQVRRLWTIVSFQRDLGVNLAGIEVMGPSTGWRTSTAGWAASSGWPSSAVAPSWQRWRATSTGSSPAAHHGHRRRGQRARHALHHPPRLPRPRDHGPTPSACGRRVSGLALALGPVIGGVLVGFSTGAPSSGSTWASVSSPSCWPPVVRARVVRPPRAAASTSPGFVLGARFPRLLVVRRDPGRESRLPVTVDRGALRAVRPSWPSPSSSPSSGSRPDARPHDVPAARLRRVELRRLRRLLRHLLHLLLHRALPPGRGERIRLPDRGRLPPDGGAA